MLPYDFCYFLLFNIVGKVLFWKNILGGFYLFCNAMGRSRATVFIDFYLFLSF